jgi:hypothetical protein
MLEERNDPIAAAGLNRFSSNHLAPAYRIPDVSGQLQKQNLVLQILAFLQPWLLLGQIRKCFLKILPDQTSDGGIEAGCY